MTSTHANTDQKGIRDHTKKFAHIKEVLGCKSDQEAIDEMAKRLPPDRRLSRNDIYSIAQMARKYDKSNPTRTIGPKYVDLVIHTMESEGWDNPNLKKLFVYDSYADFEKCSPLRAGDRSRMQKASSVSNRISMGYSRPPKIPTIEQMVHDGLIDQLLVWQPEDAPESWRKVVHHPNYPQYRHCTDTLLAITETQYWKDYLGEHSPDGIVSLGCGSASKDVMMIENLAKHVRRPVRLTLVDYSTAMLYDTSSEVRREIQLRGLSQQISVHDECADFLHLVKNEVRREGIPVVFMITGGTIGNIDEGKLFSSIANCSEVGDLFLVGAECLPGKGSDESQQSDFDESLNRKYNQPYAMKLLEPALRAAWPFIRCAEHDFKVASQKHIKPRLIRGRGRDFSRVPNSVSVVFEVEESEPNIVLLASTRYDESELIVFAKDHDFELVEKAESKENPLYRTFVFQYKTKTTE